MKLQLTYARLTEEKMSDYIVRAVTKDGSVRAFCAITKDLCTEAQKMHKTSPVATAALGRLLTAASMMGTMLKSEDEIITLQMVGNVPIGRVLAVSDHTSRVKGYVDNPNIDIPKNAKGKLDVGGAIGSDGHLVVIRDLGLKEPYIGKTPLVSGEIGDDLTSYFAVSEQVPSVVGLGVLVDVDYSVKEAGGFILQVMPEACEEDIVKLEENIKYVDSVTDMFLDGLMPEHILEVLLRGFEFEITEKKDTSYFCNCTREKVEKVLISVGEEELTDILKTDKKAQLTCHFCDKVYDFSEEDLKDLLAKIKKN
jgi:molecular chaperone Hsp33